MPVLWRQNRLSNLDKAKIIVFLLPFLSASHPQSSPDCLSWCLVPLALTGFVRCSVPQFSSSPARPLTPHHRHFGSPSYRFALAPLCPRPASPSPCFALLTPSALTPLPLPHPLALVCSRHLDLLLLDCCATKLLRPALSSLLRRAGSGTDCNSLRRAYSSLEGVNVAGGWKCRRCACSGLWGCAESPSPNKITLPVSEHPLGIETPSSAVWGSLWRAFQVSLEGVNVAGGWKCWRCACSGLWGCAESPSTDKITLPVQEHPPGTESPSWLGWRVLKMAVVWLLGGRNCRGRVERLVKVTAVECKM